MKIDKKENSKNEEFSCKKIIDFFSKRRKDIEQINFFNKD